MCPHRIPKPLAKLGGQLLVPLRAHVPRFHRARPCVALDPRLAAVPDQDVAGGQLADLREDGQRSRNRVEGQERLERVEIDLAPKAGLGHERLQLRGEGERPAGVPVVEGLDPEAVPPEHQAASARVPQRQGEHAAQGLYEVRPAILVEVHEHLRVAAGGEAVAAALQLGSQLSVVVDLPVLDDLDAAILVADRLVAAVEVDDREPPRREADRAVHEHALAVGATVDHRLVHGREGGSVGT